MRAIIYLLGLLVSSSAFASQWYLNGAGPDAPYQIWEANDDGYPTKTSPAISPPAGATHLAWPSAIQEGSTLRVYASAYVSGWKTVRLYTSIDSGVTFADQGVVFSSDASEPHGIGPTYVMRDPAGANLYVMYYLVRGSGGPGPSIAVATSPDGLAWTRQGTIISSSLPEEAGGLSMSYACRRASGDMVLVYHGYSADPGYTKGVAIVATASGPMMNFGSKTIVKSWDDFSTTVSGTAGQDTSTVLAGVAVPIGIPLLINGTMREHIVANRQDGTRIWFDRPLLYTHSGADLYSMAKHKIELSFIRELPDGSWQGIATLYHPAALSAEYTTALSAPLLTGPWSYDQTGFRFQPWLPGILHSFENPTPVISTASCAN